MLPLARLRFDAIVETPLHLPDYAGSALRGAFGSALRRMACMTRQPECSGCPLTQTCPYAVIFETMPPEGGHALQKFSAIPRPYIIEPPPWGSTRWQPGEPLAFHMVLIGRALYQLPLIILAWQHALQRGIGPGDGRARLKGVIHENDADCPPIFDPGNGRTEQPATALPAPVPTSASRLTLKFNTPLRLQQEGRALAAESITPLSLIMALARRASLLGEFHGSGPLPLDFARMRADAETLADTRELTWRDGARRSSRQQKLIPLGGLIGNWHLEGSPDTLARLLPLLHLGQWIHVGKEATFGMGGYQLGLAS